MIGPRLRNTCWSLYTGLIILLYSMILSTKNPINIITEFNNNINIIILWYLLLIILILLSGIDHIIEFYDTYVFYFLGSAKLRNTCWSLYTVANTYIYIYIYMYAYLYIYIYIYIYVSLSLSLSLRKAPQYLLVTLHGIDQNYNTNYILLSYYYKTTDTYNNN